MKRPHLSKIGATLLLPLVFAFLWAACTKEGPQGPAGKDGVAGVDANANCTQCHTNNQTIVAKEYQWSFSKHAEGISWNYAGGRVSCRPCHNSADFQDFVNGDTTLDSSALYNIPNVNCRTCHEIHTNYDTTDFRLSTTAPVPSKAWGASVTWDFGKGNLCVHCHQYRDRPPMDTAIHNDSVVINSSRFGAHYGSHAGIFMGVGGYEDPAYASLKQSGNHSTLVKDGCVACHVGDGNFQAHNFIPSVVTCNTAGCHSGKPFSFANKVVADPTDSAMGTTNDTIRFFTSDSTQFEVRMLLNEARDSLIAKGLLKLNAAEVWGVAGVTTTPYTKVPKEWAGLLQNYRFVLYDKSNGAHNGKYVRYLLVSGLKGIGVTRDLSKFMN